MFFSWAVAARFLKHPVMLISPRLWPSVWLVVMSIMLTAVPCAVGNDQLDGGGSAENEKTAIYRLEPSQKGGGAFKLVYFVKVPVETFWKFKTDFRSDALLTNKYITSNRFVYRVDNVVVTETRYTNLPDVVFRWQTTEYPSARTLSYVLLNPKDCGQRFNYGFIKLEAVGRGTRVTHSSYFDFFGAALWAGLPGPIGMKAFLEYTARWEQETILRLLPRYQPNSGK
jgi:hypothetical protein